MIDVLCEYLDTLGSGAHRAATQAVYGTERAKRGRAWPAKATFADHAARFDRRRLHKLGRSSRGRAAEAPGQQGGLCSPRPQSLYFVVRLPTMEANTPPAGASPPNLRRCAERALIAEFRQGRRIEPDDDGRLDELRELVVPTIKDEELDQALSDIARGDGQELRWTTRSDGTPRPPDIHSIFSSSGAALNNFGPWRLAPNSLHLHDETDFSQLRFEEKLRIFRGGRAPNLDVLLYDDKRVFAVESKLCEHLTPGKRAKFQESYERVGPFGDQSWAALYQMLKDKPERFSYLDVGQLVRHYWGLAKQTSKGRSPHAGKRAMLIYLYWEPDDADKHKACLAHRLEVADFSQLVADRKIPFASMTFRQLWDSWAAQDDPPWLAEHITLLEARYGVSLGDC